MGEAKLRGTFEERKAEAYASGRGKDELWKQFGPHRDYFLVGGKRNSGYYNRKPHRLNRAWKRRAAGK